MNLKGGVRVFNSWFDMDDIITYSLIVLKQEKFQLLQLIPLPRVRCVAMILTLDAQIGLSKLQLGLIPGTEYNLQDLISLHIAVEEDSGFKFVLLKLVVLQLQTLEFSNPNPF
ncbi:hypothetical protein RJT34_14687 [Clitoria ternatea]|uniref:Uncharacterized protein n=1 Tax=Clitoria ternatea TaxID=43366 RepID=A0AAN9PMN6_CLITE